MRLLEIIVTKIFIKEKKKNNNCKKLLTQEQKYYTEMPGQLHNY